MRKHSPRKWLHAILDLLPVLIIGVFALYTTNKNAEFNQSVTISEQTGTFEEEDTFFLNTNVFNLPSVENNEVLQDYVYLQEKQGCTLVFNNQMGGITVQSQTINGITFINNNDGTYTLSGIADGNSVLPITNNRGSFINGHKIYWGLSTTVIDGVSIRDNYNYIVAGAYKISNWNSSNFQGTILVVSGTDLSTPITVRPLLIDLTLMFNGDIPQDLLDDPERFYLYYSGDLSFNNGTLVNSNVGTVYSYNINNRVVSSIDTGSEILRQAGSVKDTKVPEGTITRKVGCVDFSTLTWSRLGNTSSGFYAWTSNSIADIKYVSSNTEIGNATYSKGTIRTGSGITGNSSLYELAIDVNSISCVTQNGTTDTPTGILYYELVDYITEQGTPFASFMTYKSNGYVTYIDSAFNGVPLTIDFYYVIDSYDSVVYNDTDVGSQLTYTLYNTTEKYFNMNGVFNLGSMWDWITLNIFNGNPPLIAYVIWNIIIYEFVMDLLFLFYTVFMFVIDFAECVLEKPFNRIK